jgi:hypothetical protein
MLYPEIEFGRRISIKLKEFFFKDEAWTPKMLCVIIEKLNQLKEIAKPFYPEKDTVELVKMLADYSQQDIAEAFAMEGVCNDDGNQPNGIGKLITRSMAKMQPSP